MYNQITGTEFFDETEIKTKSTDTVGRALVGGALFGPAGAVVGSVSAANDKTKEKTRYNYKISYINSKGEPAEIILMRHRRFGLRSTSVRAKPRSPGPRAPRTTTLSRLLFFNIRLKQKEYHICDTLFALMRHRGFEPRTT